MSALTGKAPAVAISGRPLALAAVLALTCALPAAGQVLELTGSGRATVYDGPTQFTDSGATPIHPQTRKSDSRARRPQAPRRRALEEAARVADLSYALVAAVAWRESDFQTKTTSRAGAVGEMQLMPQTARALGVDPAKDEDNLRGGAVYLKSLLIRYKGDLSLALAAYNAGPGAVDRFGGPPPYKETQAYVASILERLSAVALASAIDFDPAVGIAMGTGVE